MIALAMYFGGAASAVAENDKAATVITAGNRRIDSAVILGVVSVKPGDPIVTDRVDADIRAIYKLGYFQDVSASTQTSDKGTTLVYTVVEKPLVRDILISGNKEISSDKVKEALELRNNAPFSKELVQKSVRKIGKLYTDEGYQQASVAIDSAPDGDGVKVTVKIVEGEKILIKKIVFEGNTVFSNRKLRKTIETSEKWFLSWLTGAGTYKEEVVRNDANLIADLYFNNGYVNVRVGEPQVQQIENKTALQVTFPIIEGEQFRVGRLDFHGDLLAPKEELALKLSLKKGEVFSRAVLRGDIGTFTDFYADKGYAFANVTPATQINSDSHTIDITFEVEKGEKVYIDRINIGGNTKTRDKVIRREVRLTEGDLFSSTKLRKSKQNLMNLGFFEEANIATAPGAAANKLNLNVDVKEKSTGTFSIGGGYSSLDGLIAQGSVQQANFLGLGLRGTLAASIGSKTQTYNIGLTDPHFLDTDWTLGGDLYRTKRDYTNYTRLATGGDVKAGYALTDDISTFWMYKLEKVQNSDITVIDPTDPIEDHTLTSSIYASLTQNTTDYRIDPSKGMVNSVSVEFAGLGGTTRFLRYQGESTLFVPLGLGFVGSLHGALGYIQEVGKLVARGERYFLGGINSVRGYSSRTVSPISYIDASTTTASTTATYITDSSNGKSYILDYVGGHREQIFNAEVQFPLLKEANLKGVVFFDAGMSDDGPYFKKFLTSYGAGIRWFSPIGPLRLEYGIPLNPRVSTINPSYEIDNKNGRFEFSIGGFF